MLVSCTCTCKPTPSSRTKAKGSSGADSKPIKLERLCPAGYGELDKENSATEKQGQHSIDSDLEKHHKNLQDFNFIIQATH